MLQRVFSGQTSHSFLPEQLEDLWANSSCPWLARMVCSISVLAGKSAYPGAEVRCPVTMLDLRKCTAKLSFPSLLKTLGSNWIRDQSQAVVFIITVNSISH